MSNGSGKRAFPDVPRSWLILAALVVSGVALVFKVITQADFLAILGIVFGIHTIGSESRAKETQQIAAQTKEIAQTGTAAATVAAIQATAANDEDPPILRSGGS